MSKQEHIISHNTDSFQLNTVIMQMKERIIKEGDKPHVTVETQLKILQELSQFGFGQFLIKNQGINGYWTHYMLTHPWFGRKTGLNNSGKPLSDMERFLLDKAPTMLATQQRFGLFLQENQKALFNGATLASIPCGMLGELLYLDFSGINNIRLIGIDYDPAALDDAKILAKQQNLDKFTTLVCRNAWELNIQEEFDLISSNGLNIYEPDDNKVLDLYQQFHTALKKGGKLITSFLTYPPHLSSQCEWMFNKINPEDLLLQRIIFSDILNAKFQCYRSSQQTQKQLELAGFKNIHFLYDEAHLFPTVIAEK
ncbi:TPA: SAM-dependent methyltransferase [Legionella pneumophila]|uniref:SAM-dependent methyltransferase n=1 Tax=Legionella pneumophila TaxID=446 RepID=UPI00078860CD|nr:methyltransferase domain-containing protein [Legionella pneumophila]HAT1882694.1 methyltransferase domain-containing protein [Legionella pneumophila]HAT2114584.1 methyltransferase domain-containing protein [Legionella pneumophila]HAT8719147.1 methyltransferase domain-containing protein [Legionella pneumophila]HAU1193108.1 methyltransferase domain-containing protein [Legionella pneumophila]HBD7103384.1 methyltransferase domain-containing protein [Legionella pneumophila]